MTILWRFTRLTAVSLTGLVAGIFTEKYRRGDLVNLQLPETFKIHAASSFGIGFGGSDPITNLQQHLPNVGSTVSISKPGEINKEQRISQIMRFGFPSLDNIRSFDDFVLAYDKRNRVPHWVFEHLTRDRTKFNKEVDRSKCDFFEDNSIHPYFRGKNADYKGSGYDRGHLAAAGNHRLHQKHCEETFVLSNIAPQVGRGFNRDSWNRLEKHIRGLTKSYGNVYVCTGPLYLPQRAPDGKNYVRYEVIGSNNVAVPTHFFKIVIAEASDGHLDLESYIMPNAPIDDNAPLNAFMVPLDAIERAAGLLFFEKIDRANSFRAINGRRKYF